MQIFLSYIGSIADLKIGKIVANLEAEGFNISMIWGGIAGGENWKEESEKAIIAADWFMPLVDSRYIDSVNNWQLLSALKNQKRIIPVLLESISQPPILLEHYHYVNLTEDADKGILVLLDLLRSSREPVKENESPPSPEEIIRQKKKIAETPAPDRIFIAYSHKQRTLAQSLCDLLQKQGKAIFWDAKIKAGATWRQTIQKALDDATHVIIIWTPDAAESDEVEREVSYALSKRKIVVPILSKEIPELPYHLHGLHYIVLDDQLSKIEVDLLKALDQVDKDIWN